MIDIKYKRIFDEFIKKYEQIHINPWHQIDKKELNRIYKQLINNMDINDKYSFKYFMDYIIKRLSGLDDAHSEFNYVDIIPLNFRKFDNEILVNYSDNMKGYSLISINGVSIEEVINELEDVIVYGTSGKRDYEIEKALFNRMVMFGLPSFRNKDNLEYQIKDNNGNIIKVNITKTDKYDNVFDYKKYLYGNNTEYRIIDNCLIYNHSSVQNEYKDSIQESIDRLKQEDLSNIDTIIIDIRGNTGGNSNYNKILMDFLKTQSDKKLICLTDYRVFSAGRYALKDLISLNAITIGDEISTPINCYGESNWINIDNCYFSISGCYFNPFIDLSLSSKDEFNKKANKDILKPYIFKPDILVKQSKEDYLNGIDSVLDYALEWSKNEKRNI